VVGRGCDQCEEGSFNLQQENPDGCTDCFCFGKTARCISTDLTWTKIGASFPVWSGAVVNPMQAPTFPQIPVEVAYQNEEDEGFDGFVPIRIMYENVPMGNDSTALYFKASLEGSFLTSYGGNLDYIVVSRAADDSGKNILVPSLNLEVCAKILQNLESKIATQFFSAGNIYCTRRHNRR